MIIPFILAIILIGLYDGLPLIKNKFWRELGAVGMLAGLSAYLLIADILGAPTLTSLLDQLFSPIGRTIFK